MRVKDDRLAVHRHFLAEKLKLGVHLAQFSHIVWKRPRDF